MLNDKDCLLFLILTVPQLFQHSQSFSAKRASLGQSFQLAVPSQMARAKSNKVSTNNSANIGFEAKLWLAADKLRSNMDAAEYKHVVLGLIFLKYITDSFEEKHAELTKEKGADPEDPDEYRA